MKAVALDLGTHLSKNETRSLSALFLKKIEGPFARFFRVFASSDLGGAIWRKEKFTLFLIFFSSATTTPSLSNA